MLALPLLSHLRVPKRRGTPRLDAGRMGWAGDSRRGWGQCWGQQIPVPVAPWGGHRDPPGHPGATRPTASVFFSPSAEHSITP